jgi:beta-glucoside operon transcriptional antiterminator
VQSLYRKEYLIGEYSVALINKEIGVKLPIDEAASIALHIVNAEYDSTMSDTMNFTKLMPDALKIMKEEFQVEFDESSLHYERFVTHLKLVMQRVMKREQFNVLDLEFNDTIKNMYPKEYHCSQSIAAYLQEHLGHKIMEEEISVLTIHIRRLIIKK